MNGAAEWTGRTACALQSALRLTNEAYAEHLGIAVRTVAAWHQRPALRPKSEMQQLLDTALEQAPEPAQARFAALTREPPAPPAEAHHAADAELRLSVDPNIGAALDWLDRHAGWEPGRARRDVAARLANLDVHELHDRGTLRGQVDQRAIVRALSGYYGTATAGHGRYGAHYGGDHAAETSILTNPDWLDLACPLTPAADRLALHSAAPDRTTVLDDSGAGRAAQRLAETLAIGVRLVDMPLYRLASADVRAGQLAGTVGIAHFVHYALTMDLLESELVDAIAAGSPTEPGALPLRDSYLPDLDSVLGLADRLCAGGALALCAIARPPRPFHGGADYLLMVQERSGHVINAARRLAVIPKGFHQPLTDVRADARVGATLLRELEEELFGREDVDNTTGEQRHADPMHPTRLSEPMRWLVEEPGRLRMECTGFGLNLVSGNYEFASLIVIEDDEFWTRFGGHIAANWEASGLRQLSSLDADLVTELIGDPAWSNEGLFALLQGLRRLRQIGGERVNLPEIEWEMC